MLCDDLLLFIYYGAGRNEAAIEQRGARRCQLGNFDTLPHYLQIT
jgi:hypothetical protein